MSEYNDWAVMAEHNCVLASKEYSLAKSKALAIDNYDNEVLQKIEYLLKMLPVLKQHTTSTDVIYILDGIEKQIKEEKTKLQEIFVNYTKTQVAYDTDIQIFCNNLKLSIQTSLEILDLLYKQILVLDRDKQMVLNGVMNNFFEIIKKYVSLFGECEFRIFKAKYGK